MTAGVIPYCTVAFADTFIGAHRWIDNWQSASEEEKHEALVNATNVISMFCVFHDAKGNEIKYALPENEETSDIPVWLKHATCYEALYFLDLGNDPARPFPLGILGLIKTGQDTFDHNYEPPLFSNMARRMLENNGAEVNDPFNDSNNWGHRQWID